MTDILTLTLICGFTFLTGIGIGAAISDAINGWKPKKENSENEPKE